MSCCGWFQSTSRSAPCSSSPIESDGVIAFEVREGVLPKPRRSSPRYARRSRDREPDYTGTALDGEALDRLWVNLLHLGLLDELRYLAGPPCNLPFRSEIKAFLDHGAVAVRGLPCAGRCLSRAASGRRDLHHGMHRLGRGIHPQLPALQRPLDAVGGQPAGARPAGQGRLQHRHRRGRRAAAAFRSAVRQAVGNRRRRIHGRSRQPDRDPAPRPSGQEFLRALRHARSLLDLFRRGGGLASVHDPGGLRRGERHARQHGELPAPGLRVLRRRQPGGRDRDLPAGDRPALRLGRTDPHLDLRTRRRWRSSMPTTISSRR